MENFGAHAAAVDPPTYSLKYLKQVQVVPYSVPRTKPNILYIGLNYQQPRYDDLYKCRIATGEKLLKKNTEQISSWLFDNAGNLQLVDRARDYTEERI